VVRRSLKAWGPLGLPVVLLSLASTAWGQDQPPSSAKPVSPSTATPRAVTLPAISVSTARQKSKSKVKRAKNAQPAADGAPIAANGSGPPNVAQGTAMPPTMASQTTVTGRELNTRPVTRPGEVLEAAPGLIVTQHSGEGKANQYFLRGYNLDHGTDLAITVDDMPANMRTHGHGQGYSDLNWLMPETINTLDIRKGPYYADVGDFGSAGALSIGLIDRPEKNLAQATVGSFGYQRYMGMGATRIGTGSLLFAGEVGAYNGPWANPDDMRKINGLVRYSQGTATDGLTITGMAYSNKWNSTDQIPERAIGVEIGRFGSMDPSDGGNTNRFSLSTRMVGTDSSGSWKANVYVIKSSLDLYNNFTYFLDNSTQGDQFHQHDDRLVVGGNAARTINGSLGALRTETTFGIQTRYDDITVGLTDTLQRAFLANVRTDKVGEGSVGVYAENTVHWTEWFKTIFGWRGDYFAATDNSIYDPVNSGNVHATMGSPKFRAVIGPFYKTEYFFGAGYGMHSNDVRGATITESPVDRIADPGAASTPIGRSPLLVRTKGAEVGFRSKIIPGLDSSVSLFVLDQASELVFSGDAGDTQASRPSRRYGVEWSNSYRVTPWLAIDADLAVSHARFVGDDHEQAALYASLAGFPQAQIGNAPGNFIPNAPKVVASAGLVFGEKTGWFGTLRWRYLGESPLSEDGAFKSPATSVVNGRVGYRFDNGWRVQLDALNMLDAKTNQITYAYGSLIKTDSLFAACVAGTPPAAVCQNGVMDRVLHPMEPLAVRLTVAATF
jgi:hypothetical protein